jgi:putative phage-type endonuclease
MLPLITRVKPKDKTHWLELRSRVIGATEISALFGLSPYMTEFELWYAKKRQDLGEFEIGERGMWGSFLEPRIAAGLAHMNGWKVRKIHQYAYAAKERLGASFDYEIVDGKKTRPLEIKNVAGHIFRDQWEETESGITAPMHIELQLQHELLLAARSEATLGILVDGNTAKTTNRSANKSVQEMILDMASRFWWSIDNDKPPKPDFTRDASFIIDAMRDVKPGTVIDLEDAPKAAELGRAYLEAGARERLAAKEKEGLKAQLLMLIGEAERATHPEFSISAKLTPETKVEAFTKKSYRNFRVTAKKGET